MFSRWIAPALLTAPGAAITLALTVGLAAAGGYGLANLQSDYDSIWYMRHASYQYKAPGPRLQTGYWELRTVVGMVGLCWSQGLSYPPACRPQKLESQLA